jgi:hypothetical protein
MKPVKGRKKRHRGKKKAAERCEEPKELTLGICGSRRKLAAACRKVSHCATVAHCRRDAFKNKRTQNQIGYQKLLAVARRGTSLHAIIAQQKQKRSDTRMSHRATVPRRKRDIVKKNLLTHHRGTKDQGGKRPLLGRKKRTTMDGIRKWNPGERALLGNEGTLRKILYEIYGPKNMKRMPKASSRTWRIADWTLWRGRPPPKRKKKWNSIEEEPVT